MMTPTVVIAPVFTCPECGGKQLSDHPGGVLAIQHHNPCAIRDAEDATRFADADRVRMFWEPFIRDVTPTELTLLTTNLQATDDQGTHIDMALVLGDLYTQVTPAVGMVTILNRAWPSLGVGAPRMDVISPYMPDLRTTTIS